MHAHKKYVRHFKAAHLYGEESDTTPNQTSKPTQELLATLILGTNEAKMIYKKLPNLPPMGVAIATPTRKGPVMGNFS